MIDVAPLAIDILSAALVLAGALCGAACLYRAWKSGRMASLIERRREGDD